MTHIVYSGISPDAPELINSNEFRSVLEAYPDLCLVTTEDFDGKELWHKVTLPLPENHDECVAVVDTDNDHAFMWVLYDDFVSITDPSPALIEILKVMDAYFVENMNDRLFLSSDSSLHVESPDGLTATFDFTTGDYTL